MFRTRNINVVFSELASAVDERNVRVKEAADLEQAEVQIERQGRFKEDMQRELLNELEYRSRSSAQTLFFARLAARRLNNNGSSENRVEEQVKIENDEGLGAISVQLMRIAADRGGRPINTKDMNSPEMRVVGDLRDFITKNSSSIRNFKSIVQEIRGEHLSALTRMTGGPSAYRAIQNLLIPAQMKQFNEAERILVAAERPRRPGR